MRAYGIATRAPRWRMRSRAKRRGAVWSRWERAAILVRWFFASRRGDEAATERHAPPLRSSSERAAFEQLFARYSAPLLDYLFGMTRDRDAAADLVQETFLRAYAAQTALDAVEYPQAWLYRIATNAALSAGRRHGRFRWLQLAMIEPEAGEGDAERWRPQPRNFPRADDVAVSVVERDAVWRTLAELPPRWRATLLLQTEGGFSVAEIATLLTLQEANVRKILFRAKERFRSIYRSLAENEGRGGRP